jgi:hypothetical protein
MAKQPTKKIGFRVMLDPKLVNLIRLDAIKFTRHVETITATIISNHFSDFDSSEREKLYANIPVKRMGRKVSI